MRTKHSLRNVLVGLISQLIIVIVGFVSRKIFIVTLGGELLGVNGLYTSIISMLGLTELGIGTAIVCNLYKPLANNDEPKVLSLVQFYARAYRIIGIIVLVLGLAVTPFLNIFIKDNLDPIFLSEIFVLFLADTVISYFFAHKRSLIFADQRNYIVTLVSTTSTLLSSTAQIIILLLTKNYILFLSIKIVVRVVENIILARIADKRYPFIKTRQKLMLDSQTKGNIVANTKALSLHYVGYYLISGTDNIIISRFLGVIIVGLYSNYFLIMSTLKTLLNQFSTGIIASFGNLFAQECNDKSYLVFKKAYFINFAIYNFAAISLLCLLNPFITLWIDKGSLLSMPVVAILALNFYLTGITEVLGSVRTSCGIFRPDRYLHIFLAVLNLAVSIGLVQVIGIFGVFLGTLLCLLIKEISVLPWIVYRRIFLRPVRDYYKMLIPYFITTAFSAAITLFFNQYLIQTDDILSFLLRCLVCVVVPNGIVFLLYGKTEEFKYVKELSGNLVSRIKDRKKAA